MRLYHHPASSNARRVTITAQLLGIPLDIVHVDLMDADARRRLAEVNINGKVPVLDDEGFLLSESCAIMQYLADKVGPSHRAGAALYPQDIQARADVNRWLFWAAHQFSTAVSVMTWENVWKAMTGNGAADPILLAHGEKEVLECGRVLDLQLNGRTFLTGATMTLADIAMATPMMYMDIARLPLAHFPHLMAWFRRIEKLEAWAATEWDGSE